MPDAETHPQPCVPKWKKARTQVVTGTPNIPAFPAQWCYGLYALSPVSGLVATVPPALEP
jgi:hypothetical protein